MDKLEQTKADSPTNDAITDDVAAKAYIENFALETFNRADEAQRGNKVTRQTADTFQAAATFLHLLSIWGALEVEVAAKSKFAKLHALRIARAIKAGEDPNESNPVIEEPRLPAETAEDSIEQELRDMERQGDREVEEGNDVYRPPTVESAPDSKQPSRPGSTVQGGHGVPPLLATGKLGDEDRQARDEHDVSPIESTDDGTGRQSSIGGGYFPSLPDAPADINMTDPDESDIGDIAHQPPPASMQTAARQQQQPPFSPTDFYHNTSQPPTAPAPGSTGMAAAGPGGEPDRPNRPPPEQTSAQPPAAPPAEPPAVFQPPPAVQPSLTAFAPPPPAMQAAPVVAQAQGPPIGGYRTDDESVMAAQKHAKWAISALNFEDVGTAVKELRIALLALGAS